ncbi:hypothetical protein H7Y29_00100 [Microbacteriaceae bacterium]|nr:hypothetical protein [Candidatus Saccharibacteria bacterium]
MGKVVRSRARHLIIAETTDLPNTLGEYAGISNIDAGLREKLGKECLWLFAAEMYGIVSTGDTTADYLGLTDGIGVPAWYVGLRELTAIQDTDEFDRQTVSFPAPHESVAVFSIDQVTEETEDQLLVSGNMVADYAEVAVRLGQAVTVLEYYEYNPNHPKWWRGRPDLRIVHDTPSSGSMEA